MRQIIIDSLKKIGLESIPKSSDEELINYGLDSLMTVLLFSEIENQLNIKLSTENFNEKSFSSINNITVLMMILIVII